MASRDELNRLRAEAAKRHRAATNKISRLKQNRNVEISGSKADPRREKANIKRYTASQLRTYIKELNSFIDRKVQFVPDAHRRPVAGSLWDQYKALETRYNARVERELDKYRDIKIPKSNMTVGQRLAMMTPDHPRMGGSVAVHSPYEPINRKPTAAASAKAVRRLIRDMKNRLKPDYFDRNAESGRDVANKMLALFHRPDLNDKLNALTNKQFSFLWNLTGFATALSLGYEGALSQLSDDEKPWHTQAIEHAIEDAIDEVKWVSELDLGR